MCRGSSVVEQRPEKPCVSSSILLLGTIHFFDNRLWRFFCFSSFQFILRRNQIFHSEYFVERAKSEFIEDARWNLLRHPELVSGSRSKTHSNSRLHFRTFDGKSTAKPPKANKLALQFFILCSLIHDAQTVFALGLLSLKCKKKSL